MPVMTTEQPAQPAAAAPAERASVIFARATTVIVLPKKAESGTPLSVSVPAHGIRLDGLGAGVDEEELDFPVSPSHAPTPAATMQSRMVKMKNGRL